MENDHINGEYDDYKDLRKFLIKNNQISFANNIDNTYKKVLVLSSASYFESIISAHIINYAEKSSGADKRIVKLIENKVVERQYHTLFDWKTKNTNKFWSLFGDDTKDKVRKQIDSNKDLKTAEQAFIELGNLRNLLVHENLAEYDVNTTFEEIYNRYKSACVFVSFVKKVLDPDYIKSRPLNEIF